MPITDIGGSEEELRGGNKVGCVENPRMPQASLVEIWRQVGSQQISLSSIISRSCSSIALGHRRRDNSAANVEQIRQSTQEGGSGYNFFDMNKFWVDKNSDPGSAYALAQLISDACPGEVQGPYRRRSDKVRSLRPHQANRTLL